MPGPTEKEIELLKVLWELGEGSVRAVLDHMAPDGSVHFNTVQTQLRIMDRKGWVRHRREGRTLIYQPVYTRKQEVSRFLHQVFDGSADELVLNMLSAEKLPPETLDQLEEMIKQAREKQRRK
ncbi:BlaI/MecI/CopY family transcriptional regulator [Roseiconus nitratireducens]|uniref:BlaI/MecI/CopY family transcriptional regulator n=1 Tax=Roseiconus nitratireducens TaxID=2605748 RepID=A0A5M6CYF4_9BACT|nr:BlaI/MecI/CopY family transcriptional regulator [Roseiconus nitratireducens]KAA5539450.1 BlaI/MecI/CopY family transcriptional regulator [Roseiconus nitratireducens]